MMMSGSSLSTGTGSGNNVEERPDLTLNSTSNNANATTFVRSESVVQPPVEDILKSESEKYIKLGHGQTLKHLLLESSSEEVGEIFDTLVRVYEYAEPKDAVGESSIENALLVKEMDKLSKQVKLQDLQHHINSLTREITNAERLANEVEIVKGNIIERKKNLLAMQTQTLTSGESAMSSVESGQALDKVKQYLKTAKEEVQELENLVGITDNIASENPSNKLEVDFDGIEQLLNKFTNLQETVEKKRTALEYSSILPCDLDGIQSHINSRKEYFKQVEEKVTALMS